MTGSRDLARAAIRAQFGSDELEMTLAKSAYASQLAKTAFPELREDIDKLPPKAKGLANVKQIRAHQKANKLGPYFQAKPRIPVSTRRKFVAAPPLAKFNRNHGPDGRFSSGGGGGSAAGAHNTDRDNDRVRDDYRGNSRRGKVRVSATRAALTGAAGGGGSAYSRVSQTPRRMEQPVGDRVASFNAAAGGGGGSARAAAAARNIAGARALHQRTKRNRAIGAKAQATKAGTAKLRALIASKPAAKPTRAARPVKLGPATQSASASYQRAMGNIKAKRSAAASRNIAGARALHAKTQRNRAIGAKSQATKAGKAKLLGLVAQSHKEAAGRRNKASYNALMQQGKAKRHKSGVRRLKALLKG